MFNISVIGIFVYIIISSSSMGTFLMYLENVAEFLALLFSSITYAFRRLYNGEPLYETIGCIGTPGLCIFGGP